MKLGLTTKTALLAAMALVVVKAEEPMMNDDRQLQGGGEKVSSLCLGCCF